MLILAKAYTTDYRTEDSTHLCVVYPNSSRSFKLYMYLCNVTFITDASVVLSLLCV